MKHIKKKYLFEESNLPIKDETAVITVMRSDAVKLKQVSKDTVPFLQTVEGTNIRGMHYSYNVKQTVIPIPDLTLVYFDFGYINNQIRKDYEKKLFDKLTSEEEITEQVSNEVYHYFGAASSCIIGMFNALEAFVNSVIPHNFVYEKALKQKTERYNKEQVQKNIDIHEKIKEVLPRFSSPYDLSSSLISELRKLRNDIVHTKSNIDHSLQEELLKKLLDFNYEKCMEDIRDFMNYYKPNYIEDCDCGKDF